MSAPDPVRLKNDFMSRFTQDFVLDPARCAMGISDLLFAGVSTDLCVDNTARAATIARLFFLPSLTRA